MLHTVADGNMTQAATIYFMRLDGVVISLIEQSHHTQSNGCINLIDHINSLILFNNGYFRLQ